MKNIPILCKIGLHIHKKPLIKVNLREVFFKTVRTEYSKIGKICLDCGTRMKTKQVKLLPQ